jgi:glycosyltransferase involved in cell wall biosynthesis
MNVLFATDAWRRPFLGQCEGEALAEIYAAADVFVFPSRPDAFGVVLLEALASGVPIAACPVMGPIDVLGTSGTGVLDEDLRRPRSRRWQSPATDAGITASASAGARARGSSSRTYA